MIVASPSGKTTVLNRFCLYPSVHSRIWALRQTSFGPDNYTMRWEVKNTSSISKFRVYHDGELHGTTLMTNYTIGGLLSCQQYPAMVEALCGDDVLMSAKTVTAHTGNVGSDDKTGHTCRGMVLVMQEAQKDSSITYVSSLFRESWEMREYVRSTLTAEERDEGFYSGMVFYSQQHLHFALWSCSSTQRCFEQNALCLSVPCWCWAGRPGLAIGSTGKFPGGLARWPELKEKRVNLVNAPPRSAGPPHTG